IANKLLTISNETKIIERRELSSEKFEKYCKKYFQINLSDFQHI
ncbi:arylamine N-acetyltransferase, partial [Citrobacter sp. TBCS-11]